MSELLELSELLDKMKLCLTNNFAFKARIQFTHLKAFKDVQKIMEAFHVEQTSSKDIPVAARKKEIELTVGKQGVINLI